MTDYAAILDGAADYLEANGWIRGSFFPADSIAAAGVCEIIPMAHWIAETKSAPACTMGAIATQCMNQDQYTEAHDRIAAALGITWTGGERDIVSVPDWNDMKERTQDEVVELLRMEALKIRVANTAIPAPTPEKVHA